MEGIPIFECVDFKGVISMHYAVATMKKLKADNLPGILRHDFRVTDHHKNPDIDPSKSKMNLELVADHKLHKRDVMDYIDRRRAGTRKLRKDAVVMNEWIISSDHDFFANLTDQQTEQYFRSAVQYFADRFGKENVMYANVHLDESTPHMHLGIVPFTADDRLSAKRVFDRNALRKIQSEFPKFMQEQGYNVVRGSEQSKRKKLTVAEYKHVQDEIVMQEVVTDDLKNLIREVDPEAKVSDEPIKLFEWLQVFVRYVEERWAKLVQREKKVEKQEKELAKREMAVDWTKESLEDFEKMLRKDQDSLREQVALLVESTKVTNAKDLANAVRKEGYLTRQTPQGKERMSLVEIATWSLKNMAGQELAKTHKRLQQVQIKRSSHTRSR